MILYSFNTLRLNILNNVRAKRLQAAILLDFNGISQAHHQYNTVALYL